MIVLEKLKKLLELEAIRDIDFYFAKAIYDIAEPDEEKVKNAATIVAALLSSELSKGNVCIDKKLLNRMFNLSRDQFVELFGITIDECLDLAQQSCTVGSEGSHPFVFSNGLFYTCKMWLHEQNVANAFKEEHVLGLDEEQIELANNLLKQLFPRPYNLLFKKIKDNNSVEVVYDVLDVVDKDGLDEKAINYCLSSASSSDDLQALDLLIPEHKCLNWQKTSVGVALLKKYVVISGGPGTGKTTTVCKLLAALISISDSEDERLEIKLVAPTGKAAARLTESIANTITDLPVSEQIKNKMPTKASTIHRLLGAVHGRSEYRFNKNNRLNLDVLVVDEASMIDLPMMSKIINALPSHAKLILLGDKDQLASVDAGAVLGDICSFSEKGFSKFFTDTLSSVTNQSISSTHNDEGVSDKICVLRKSYRFHANSGIGKVARAINNGYPKAAISVLEDEKNKDVNLTELTPESYAEMINTVSESYKFFLDGLGIKSPKQALDEFSNSRLLCALREGNFGVNGLNSAIEKKLEGEHLIALPKNGLWYEGRPVMITQNDYGLGLYNGDIGLTMRSKTDGTLKVYFEMPDGEVKGFLTCRIPDHETAFAMTIHKSQGSEFSNTFMVLPVDYSPIITRELVYTGITRAKNYLHLYAHKQTLTMGIAIKTERASGLKSVLGF